MTFGSCNHQDAFSGGQKHQAFGAKTPHSQTDGSLVAAIWMGVLHIHCDFALSAFIFLTL
jgi:hypothetical protein